MLHIGITIILEVFLMFSAVLTLMLLCTSIHERKMTRSLVSDFTSYRMEMCSK